MGTGKLAVLALVTIPGLELPRVVVHMGAIAEKKLGDITRSAIVAPDERDVFLRWGIRPSALKR